jgi:hypothetical protein
MPQLYDRLILEELAGAFTDAFAATCRNRFRSREDLVLRFLYAAFLFRDQLESENHEGVVLKWQTVDYFFEMLSGDFLRELRSFRKLLRLRPASFCINDDLDKATALHPTLLALKLLLIVYFPGKSSFERFSLRNPL